MEFDHSDNVEYILNHFDWKRVHETMETLDWQWAGEGVPSIESMIKTARRLLRDAVDTYKRTPLSDGQAIVTGTGGFEVELWNKGLKLRFIVTEWEEELPE